MNGIKRKYDESHPISFLAGSANAQRLRNTKKKVEVIRYQRNVNASFQSNQSSTSTTEKEAASNSTTFSLENDQKEKAQLISDSLTLGPKDIQAPEDDLHFTKFEPNTGIELKKRFVPNLNVSGYLEGRTLVPISTLYSICLPGESNDGKCTIPIDGDWLIIGAIAERKASYEIKGYKLDTKGRKIDEEKFKAEYLAYMERKGGGPPDMNDLDNPWRDVQKEVPKSVSQTYTLVDIGQRLEKQETAGDSMLMVTVYKAEEVRVDGGANRKYIGGSGGAYELMATLGAGTVVCLLNPIITHGPTRSTSTSTYEQSNTDKKKSQSGSDKSMIGLKPRRWENVLTIGIAKHVGKCESARRDGQACGNFIDLRTSMRACSYHSHLSTSKSRRGRQEFANNTSIFMRSSGQRATPYSFSEGMAFSQSKAYVSKGYSGASADSRFDMDAGKGREAEAKFIRDAREKEAENKISSQLIKNRRSRPKDKVPQTKGADVQEQRPSQNVPQTTSDSQKPEGQRNSYGSRLVQDALKELKKSTAGLPNGIVDRDKMNSSQGRSGSIRLPGSSEKKELSSVKLDKVSKKSFFVFEYYADKSLPSIEQLLARHSASAQIPMPLMNLKVGVGKSAVRAPSNPSLGRNLKLAPKRPNAVDSRPIKMSTDDDSSSDDDLVIERVVKPGKTT
ncbi:uncharacterized protein FA14DRAFT_155994 [Meira miltonrushii]|uniref:Zinc finger Mcm10/DnaG-type domain-containing protein n=1 Tax=Meira miltonrushii TaxID=1280837 RepID=A0A316V6S9_9BASI|nr:uncharacterized protein FA14DRAFT_155994 [Meira miltonrushii]PWN33297.1 hypothetical protein FA14DRAFT_155994 [Meira miltonrushii]